MYTQGFFTRKIGTFEAMAVIFCLSILPGMALGYTLSIQLIMMSLGANYSQQALLSMVGDALCFKFVFAPLIDTYFLSYIGKSKTYIVAMGLISGLLLIGYSPFADKAIKEKEVLLMTCFWLVINLLTNIEGLAFESWTLSITEKHYRKYMPILIHTGFCFGSGFSFNAFMCFNDVKWIADTFYGGARGVAPWVTHSQFCVSMAAVSLILSMYVLIMVKEKIIIDNEDGDEVEEQARGDERNQGLIDTIVLDGMIEHDQRCEQHLRGGEDEENGNLLGKFRAGNIGTEFDYKETRTEARKSLVRNGPAKPKIYGLGGVICEFIPKMFKNRGMRLLAFQIMASRFFFELYKRSIDLRLVEKGLPTGKLAVLNAIKVSIYILGRSPELQIHQNRQSHEKISVGSHN